MLVSKDRLEDLLGSHLASRASRNDCCPKFILSGIFCLCASLSQRKPRTEASWEWICILDRFPDSYKDFVGFREIVTITECYSNRNLRPISEHSFTFRRPRFIDERLDMKLGIPLAAFRSNAIVPNNLFHRRLFMILS